MKLSRKVKYYNLDNNNKRHGQEEAKEIVFVADRNVELWEYLRGDLLGTFCMS